jgi:tetratricopeptide (TPR) repeat protein
VEDSRKYETLSLLDAESVAVGADGLEWIPVRRGLGIGAFGVNAFRAAREGDTVVEDHVESPGQEELYVVIRGRARFTIDQGPVELGPGDAVFVADPGSRRHAVALEDGTTVLAVGGWRGRPYHSLPWEPIYLARSAMRAGDWAAALEILEREGGEHRDTAIVSFRIACCHARLGEDEPALAELRRAIEINPDVRAQAENEDAFAALRESDAWPP